MRKWHVAVILAFLLLCFSYSVLAIEEGEMLPDFDLKDLAGNDVKISDYFGEYVIFEVWTTWCGACRKAMEAFLDNYEKFQQAGIKVIAISADQKIDAPIEYVEKEKLPFTILHGSPNQISQLWNVTGIPSMFFVNPEGKIILRKVGFSTFDNLWEAISQKVDVSKVE